MKDDLDPAAARLIVQGFLDLHRKLQFIDELECASESRVRIRIPITYAIPILKEDDHA